MSDKVLPPLRFISIYHTNVAFEPTNVVYAPFQKEIRQL